MTARSVIKELFPPIFLRVVRRLFPRPAPPRPRPLLPAEHPVTGGPLKGGRLFVNDSMPSFREMLAGTYDDHLFKALGEARLDGTLVLDVGAHIGYHALAFAALLPGSRIAAFEPNPANVERMRTNLALNPSLMVRVDLLPIALSGSTGSIQFNSSSNLEDQTSSGGYLEGASKPLGDEVYRKSGFTTSLVETRRLDDLAAERAWPRVGMIKLDVEGAEHLVLSGATEVLRKDGPLLLIEVHSVVCMLEVLRILHPLGYEARLLHEDRASRCFISASIPA